MLSLPKRQARSALKCGWLVAILIIRLQTERRKFDDSDKFLISNDLRAIKALGASPLAGC